MALPAMVLTFICLKFAKLFGLSPGSISFKISF